MGKNADRKRKQPPAANSTPRWGLLAVVAMLCVLGGWLAKNFVRSTTSDDRSAAQANKADGGQIGSNNDEAETLKPYELPSAAAQLSTEQLQSELEAVAKQLEERFGDDPTALHSAAMILAELKQSENAKRLWQRCLDSGGLAVGPIVGLAGLLKEQGDDESAIELMLRLNEQSPEKLTPEFYEVLSDTYSQMGELEKSESAADAGVQRFPDVATLRVANGLAKSQLQNWDAAAEQLQAAIRLGDQSISTRNSLVTVLNRLGKTDEAKQLMERLVEVPSRPIVDAASEAQAADSGFQNQYRQALSRVAIPMLRNATAVALAHRRSDLAETWSRLAIAEQPDNPALYMDLSSALRSAGRLEDALAVQQRLLEVQPENPLNSINLASVASQLNQPALAEATIRSAVQQNPSIAYLHGELARLALARSDFALASDSAKRAAELEPDNVEWLLMLAVIARANENSIEMATYLQRARTLAPTDPRVINFLTGP